MDLTNMLPINHPIFIAGVGILGLIIGSFLNVVIYRLPLMLKHEYEKEFLDYYHNRPSTKHHTFNLAVPHSYCPRCKIHIRWWRNIPIISYIILKGKCHNCKKPIIWRYPLVEFLSCLATIFIVLHLGTKVQTLPILLLTWMLIAAIFIDFEQQLLPDNITLPLIWGGLLLNTNYIFASPQDAIIGAISGYLFLWSVAKIFKIIRKVDGMGYRDFKLLAVFGAWLGWQILPLVILASSLSGLIVGIFFVAIKKHKISSPIPFGPYIATAGWLTFFWGQTMLNWYRYHL